MKGILRACLWWFVLPTVIWVPVWLREPLPLLPPFPVMPGPANQMVPQLIGHSADALGWMGPSVGFMISRVADFAILSVPGFFAWLLWELLKEECGEREEEVR